MNQEEDNRKIKGIYVDEEGFYALAEKLWVKDQFAIVPLRSPVDKSVRNKKNRGLVPVDRYWQKKTCDPDPFVIGSQYANGFYPNLAIATGSPGSHVLLSMNELDLRRLPLSKDLIAKICKSSKISGRRGGGMILKYNREEFPNGIPTIELGKSAILYGNGHYIPIAPSFTLEWNKRESSYEKNSCDKLMYGFGVSEVSKADILEVLQCFGKTLPERKEAKEITHGYMEGHKESIVKFISACCTVGFGRRIQTTTFVDELNKWCEQNNATPVNNARVGNILKPMGFKRRQCRVNGELVRFYEGLSISMDVTSVTGECL